jgi:hypothetical protein
MNYLKEARNRKMGPGLTAACKHILTTAYRFYYLACRLYQEPHPQTLWGVFTTDDPPTS